MTYRNSNARVAKRLRKANNLRLGREAATLLFLGSRQLRNSQPSLILSINNLQYSKTNKNTYKQ